MSSDDREMTPWRHGLVSTPLYTSAFVYLTGLGSGVAQDASADLPLGLLGVGSVAGVVAASASRFVRAGESGRRARWFHTGFTAAWTGAAAAWLNITAHGTPWTLASATALAAATAALAPVYAVDRWMRAPQIAAKWEAEAKAARGNADWEELFAVVGARGVTVTGPKVPTRGGYELPLAFAPGGATFETLLTLLGRLEVAKGDLRAGSLRLVRGDVASTATLRVTEVDVLSRRVDLPVDAHPITINEPISIGDLESGEPIEITFRQNSILIAGMKGSGKSVTLHVIISLLTRCTDAVIWMIDMAAGNTAKRWLRPWLEGWQDSTGREIDRPILDWVATSEDEAVRMLNAAHAVADGRAGRMAGGKVVPRPELPAIILISDENSDLMAWSMSALKPKIRLLKKGRKAAIDVIDAVQRGTGPNTGGGEAGSQYDTVIGMKVNKKGETQHVFPDYYNQVDLSKLPGKGALMILDADRREDGGPGPEKGKVYFVHDDDEPSKDGEFTGDEIEKLAAARWDIRPDLDEASQQDAAPYGYAERWNPDRIGWLTDAYGLTTTAASTPATNAPTPGNSAAPGSLPSIPTMQDYLDRYANGGGQPKRPDVSTPTTAELEAMFRAPAASNPATGPAQPEPQQQPETADTADDARKAALLLILAAGTEGTGASALERQLKPKFGTTRQTIAGWLKTWADEGQIARVGTGTKTRYVHRQHHTDEA